jgi:hypothetical protein
MKPNTTPSTPKKFPVTLETFLRHTLPKKYRPADRMRLYRKFIRQMDVNVFTGKMQPEQVIAIMRERQFTANEFVFWGAELAAWFERWHPEHISEVRSEAAKKRRRARPPLDELKAILKAP